MEFVQRVPLEVVHAAERSRTAAQSKWEVASGRKQQVVNSQTLSG